MKKIGFALFFTVLGFLAGSLAHAEEDDVLIATTPIGSPYFRHLAHEMQLDLHELVKFEKRGFGRTEIATIVLISSSTGRPLKEYGKRRLKDKTSIREFAAEAHLNYDELHEQAVSIKKQIEAMGDKNLPPPIYEEKQKVSPTPEKKKKE